MIELANVTKTYRMGEVEIGALRGVNLTVEDGEMVAVMGASGSGKSTLMNILGCLDVPTSGQYSLDGVSIGRLSDSRLAAIRNRKIGFVFQSYNLLSRLTAESNVELPLLYARKGGSARLARETLGRVGLADRTGHRPTEMSGGQQQRVAIARALVNEPSLLLLDEPTGNLDTQNTVELLELLRRYNAERRQTMVLVTHDPLVSEACDRVLTMRDGVILEA